MFKLTLTFHHHSSPHPLAPSSYILAVTYSGRVIRYVPGANPPDVILSIPGLHSVRSFVILPEEHLLFYIDGETETIKSVNMLVSEKLLNFFTVVIFISRILF